LKCIYFSSEIGAEEAEEVGVEHLLRDIKVSVLMISNAF
jgi:hypothetical protein